MNSTIRPAEEADLRAIREIFLASYGEDYTYPQYYDLRQLKRMLYSDDTMLLVAVDEDSQRVAGTASVLLQMGAHADLLGEFGRLAVHPDFRGQGLGTQLMADRVERVRERLHLGLVEPRVNHPFSQKISLKHGFAPVGFLPMHQMFDRRESAILCARYFGDALQLRRNHPRIIPEAYRVGEMALGNCGIRPDLVVDEDAPAYPHVDDFQLDEWTLEGHANLLKLQRGRVTRREIFGPLRLHYGTFKLRAGHSTYLLALDHGQLVGAVGCLIDELEKAVRVFELVTVDDLPIHFLLQRVLDRCRDEWKAEYLEVDVSAYAPRMQRTLLEAGFLPSAYIPAMTFHRVERLDALKMSRLLVPPDFTNVFPIDASRPMVELVTSGFARAAVLPEVAQAASSMRLLAGLTPEQAGTLASICVLECFSTGQALVREGQCASRVYLILRGDIAITAGGGERPLASLGAGDCLGERGFLRRAPHSASATALGPVKTAALDHEDLRRLIRRRPDIGVVLYRNLAEGLCQKLLHTDQLLTDGFR